METTTRGSNPNDLQLLSGASRPGNRPPPTVDDALRYAAAGLAVFPCRPGGKEPAIPKSEGGRGHQDATTDPEKIRAWWSRYPNANIGFEPGSAGWMVADHDSYKPEYDAAEVSRGCEGPLPATPLRQRTPRGGSQDFYQLAEGEEVRPSASRIAPGLDVRSSGSYVLLPPSRTVDGAYTWAHGDGPLPKPAYRTDGMVRAAGRKRAVSAHAQEWLIPADMPAHVEAAVRWLQSDKCKPAIEGQGGNTTTYNTAAMMRSFGLSEETALDLLLRIYNAKCDPAWEPDEAEAVVRNAYAYATSAPGNMTAAYRDALVRGLFKPAAEAAGDAPAAMWAANWSDEKDEPVCWLWHEVLEATGMGILCAPEGNLKTQTLLHLAACAATGRPCLGKAIARPGPVLYLCLEGRAVVQRRVRAVCRELGIDPAELNGRLFFNPKDARGDVLLPPGTETLKAAVAEIEQSTGDKVVLVIVDTLREALDGSVSDEKDVNPLVRAAKELTTLDLAVLFAGHVSQESTGRAIADRKPKGLTDFANRFDLVLMQEADVAKSTGAIWVSKVRNGPSKYRIDLGVKCGPDGIPVPVLKDATAELFRPDAAKPNAVAEAQAARIMDEALADALRSIPGKAWSTRALADKLALGGKLGMSSDTLRKRVLPSLRETEGTHASRCYDPDTSPPRWRWQEPAANVVPIASRRSRRGSTGAATGEAVA